MPRESRIYAPGAIHRVMVRGIERGRPRDFEDALSVLERSRKMPDFEYLKHWSGRLRLAAELDYVLGE